MTASYTLSDPSASLERITVLLDLIWRRNKNQHRGQAWWKWLGLLRKAIRVLVKLEGEEKKVAARRGRSVTAVEVRDTFEMEAELRERKDMWTEWTREVVVPKAYLAFSSVVGDKQFAALGVALMGLLGDVGAVAGLPKATRATEGRPAPAPATDPTGRVMASIVTITGAEGRELADSVHDLDELGEVVERSTKQPKKKKQEDVRLSTEPGGLCGDTGGGGMDDVQMEETTPLRSRHQFSDTALLEDSSAHTAAGPSTSTGHLKTATVVSPSPSLTKQSTQRADQKAGRTTALPLGANKTKKRKKANAIDDMFAGLL